VLRRHGEERRSGGDGIRAPSGDVDGVGCFARRGPEPNWLATVLGDGLDGPPEIEPYGLGCFDKVDRMGHNSGPS
jgi:hypothetical protein